MLAIAFMKDIFAARNEFDACFMISALFMSVNMIGAFNGEYSFFIISFALSLSHPITILSGCMKSLTALPSLKNSGLLTTSKSTLCAL